MHRLHASTQQSLGCRPFGSLQRASFLRIRQAGLKANESECGIAPKQIPKSRLSI
jgi:hypothetical protein